MTHRLDGGPAFPTNGDDWQDGMSLRVYAAIQLRVPDSGLDWLDDMIRKASDRDLGHAREAYQYADAMLAGREKGGDS